MVVDMLGGIFSDLSLVFKAPPFNVIAAISYSLVVVRTHSLALIYVRRKLMTGRFLTVSCCSRRRS